jgi:hypothetical protein
VSVSGRGCLGTPAVVPIPTQGSDALKLILSRNGYKVTEGNRHAMNPNITAKKSGVAVNIFVGLL